MESGKYYVIGYGNNLIESLTKEQILAAITQAVESHSIADVDTGFVTTLKEQNSNTGLKFWVGTTAQYNAIEQKDENCFYVLTDDTELDDFAEAIQNLNTTVSGATEQIEQQQTQINNLGNYIVGDGGINDQIHDLNDRYQLVAGTVVNLNTRTGVLETDVSDLKSRTSNLESSASVLQNGLRQVVIDVNALEDKLDYNDAAKAIYHNSSVIPYGDNLDITLNNPATPYRLFNVLAQREGMNIQCNVLCMLNNGFITGVGVENYSDSTQMQFNISLYISNGKITRNESTCSIMQNWEGSPDMEFVHVKIISIYAII